MGTSPVEIVSIEFALVESVNDYNVNEAVVGLFVIGFVRGPTAIAIETPLAVAMVYPVLTVIACPLTEHTIVYGMEL